jgi:hypothetical protein
MISRTLEYNDTMQLNLNKLSIEHLVVEDWHILEECLVLILQKDQVQQESLDKDQDKNENNSDISGASFISEGSIEIEDGRWEQCKILNPTCMSVSMKNNQQYKQLRMSE